MKLLFSLITLMLILNGCANEQQYVEVNSKLKYTMKECKSDAYGVCKTKIVNKIDKIVVSKKEKILYTYSKGKIVDKFRISMGKNWNKGHKKKIGDFKTPEGSYKISYKQFSKNYYKSLKISYPNNKDRRSARSEGHSPGGLIMIHGQPKWNAAGKADGYMLKNDWTAGCIALRNNDMDRLFYATKSGKPIEIKS